MTAEFWITTAAIVLGPLTAVLVTHWLQKRSDVRQRRLFVFRSLMTTRRAPLGAEQVQALNLVEIEFFDQPTVIRSFERLLNVYNDAARWRSEDEEVRRGVSQEVDDRTVDLMNAIGQVLGYKLEKLDLLRGGYYPEAFSIAEKQQQEIRELFVGLNNGSKVLPVGLVDVRYPEKMLEDARNAHALVEYAKRSEESAE